jgi:hypothetical protein
MSGHDALVSQCKRCLDGTGDVKDQMREALDACENLAQIASANFPVAAEP